ncbi:MAG: pectin esterase [Lachnospiraceae bacterium]|nr:pectin esterase [Lachnospiraceae bacterium]
METIHATPSDSLQNILAAAKPGTKIFLAEGIYREKVQISTPDIELIGAGADSTIIVYNDFAKKLDQHCVEYNTFRTWTMAVTAPHVRLKNITVENDAHSPKTKGQEVALTVYANDFSAEHCRFLSTQDTVFLGPLPDDLIERYNGFLKDELRAEGAEKQYFANCLLAGTVDFIFGCGDALFQNCEIRSLYEERGYGYVAAPAHALSQQIGFVFQDCRFTCDQNVPDESVFLARPWRDFGKASFVNCIYGPHIAKTGFDKWNDTARDKTARFSEFPKNEGRVSWSALLSEQEKEKLIGYFR